MVGTEINMKKKLCGTVSDVRNDKSRIDILIHI